MHGQAGLAAGELHPGGPGAADGGMLREERGCRSEPEPAAGVLEEDYCCRRRAAAAAAGEEWPLCARGVRRRSAWA
jgi:hypothetical protein